MQTRPRGPRGRTPGANLLIGRLAPALMALMLMGATFAPREEAQADWPPRWSGKIVHASWYGREFARRRTASGDYYDPHGLTGAHRTLPLGTRLLVTNLETGLSVEVTINDRGPFVGRRELDLSYGAARAIGMLNAGVTRVLIRPVLS